MHGQLAPKEVRINNVGVEIEHMVILLYRMSQNHGALYSKTNLEPLNGRCCVGVIEDHVGTVSSGYSR